MISIVILSLWTIGNNIIIMLAGIQDIPQSYYESAQIDGAGAIRQIFSITLPLCTPTIYFNLIVTIIAAFQVFQQPLILTNGGPLNSTYTAAIHMYNKRIPLWKNGICIHDGMELICCNYGDYTGSDFNIQVLGVL